MLFTVSTAGCGKNNDFQRNIANQTELSTDEFAEKFFTECELPYRKISASEVQNTPEEYLFYIHNGSVYRTLNDYAVVIVARKEIKETDEQKGGNYNDAFYQLFEEDEVDLLRCCASGKYALMALPSAIPDWETNEIVTKFMEYAEKQ